MSSGLAPSFCISAVVALRLIVCAAVQLAQIVAIAVTVTAAIRMYSSGMMIGMVGGVDD